MKIINKFNEFKETFNTPKSKMIFYTLFILILIVFIRLGNNNKIVEEEPSLSQTNYQFEYHISYQDNSYNITGTRYNEKQLLDYDNKRYYLKDNTLYEILNNTITKVELDTSILTELLSENIYNNITKNTKKIELNIDDTIVSTYNILYKEYLYEIITHDKQNKTIKVEINQEDLNLHITINYSNIGKINKIEVNYEEV